MSFIFACVYKIEYLRKVLGARMTEGSGRPQKLFIYVKIIYNKTVQTLDLVCEMCMRIFYKV